MRVPLSVSLAAFAAALVAGPVHAADTVGQIDLSYSNVRWEWPGRIADNTDVAVGGAFAATFANGWGVQVDGRSDSYAWEDEEGRDTVGFAAVHVYKRGDGWTAGAFAGPATFYGAAGEAAGLEAQVHLPNATVSASMAKAVFHGWSDYGLWDAQVSGRWFVTDDFALGAAVGYVDWDDAQREITGWNLGVDAEYKPWEASPVSLFAGWRRDENDYRLYDYGQDTLTVGVRVNLGANTLRERDRRGPSLTGAQALGDHLLHY